jgi:hypothetical protein
MKNHGANQSLLPICLPSIGLHGAGGFCRLGNEAVERLAGAVRDAPQADVSDLGSIGLDRHGDQGLLAGFPTMHRFQFSSPIRFVHFYDSRSDDPALTAPSHV